MPINGIRVENNKLLGTGTIHNNRRCDRTKCMFYFLGDWANQTPEYNNFNNELYGELTEKLAKYKDNIITYSLFTFDVIIKADVLIRSEEDKENSGYEFISSFEFTFEHKSLSNDIAMYADNARSEKEIAQKIINLYPKDYFNNRYCVDHVITRERCGITEDEIKEVYRELVANFFRKLANERIFFNSEELLDSNIIPVPVLIKENLIKIAFFYLHSESN